MNKSIRIWASAVIGVGTLAVSSCAYDPYYTAESSYGYGAGYGDGYGYGGSSFSTSFFVSTGDPRWGYDPYCHSYYDYHRRAYYDPFLYGYYPVGYRPAFVYGVPHPHGWNPGRGYCPPPGRVRSYELSNYRNRESMYRRENFSWANQVRQRDAGPARGPSGANFPQRSNSGNFQREGNRNFPQRLDNTPRRPELINHFQREGEDRRFTPSQNFQSRPQRDVSPFIRQGQERPMNGERRFNAPSGSFPDRSTFHPQQIHSSPQRSAQSNPSPTPRAAANNNGGGHDSDRNDGHGHH